MPMKFKGDSCAATIQWHVLYEGGEASEDNVVRLGTNSSQLHVQL